MGGDAKKQRGTVCELCGAPAAVHCAADEAFLCAVCDANVHGANFLASRHLRRSLAATEAADSASTTSSASSSCVSTADSASSSVAPAPRARRRPARAEVVLEGWAKRMGLAAGAARRRAAAAGRALRARGRGIAAARVPLRVAMAAALWSEVTGDEGGGGGEATLLRRLEACAHVPARCVVGVATWMARARRREAAEGEEGWAECSLAGPKSNPGHF